ncbi:T9SS type A sorting domain-containing protein, partial [Algibacter aquimarinus]|uniref:T9SS type A sorting domain-containing protein n=1 Tax=Algibacter aquimarinus TaxID=1136748 RepID=UPI0031E76BB9
CTADLVLNLTVTPATVWYLDADGDNFAISTVTQCTDPGIGYTTTVLPLTDCDDTDNTIYPGATETPNNGIDEDCNGSDLITLNRDDFTLRNVSIIPNPFNDNITINLPLGFNNSDFTIKILDLNGRVIIDRQYSSMNSRINVSGLNKLDEAPYLFKITNKETGATIHKRLIKH